MIISLSSPQNLTLLQFVPLVPPIIYILRCARFKAFLLLSLSLSLSVFLRIRVRILISGRENENLDRRHKKDSVWRVALFRVFVLLSTKKKARNSFAQNDI